MTGRVHSYETFGAVDGPGVRFVVFLHGCSFRCRYCHNPDTWAQAVFEEVSPEAVLKRALRYRSYWGETGGLTVSGGEPMLQPAFVTALFEQTHAAGATTCLDTAAGPFDAASPEMRRLLDVTDHILLDIKHLDPAAHRALTGADNAPVLACARYLAQIGKPVWLRHVLVPGVTDDRDHLLRLHDFARSLSNVTRVEILPYHTLGVEKWRKLGLAYTLEGVEPPDEESLAAARRLVTEGEA